MATKRRNSLARKCTEKSCSALANEQIQARLKRIKIILHKGVEHCSDEELKVLRESPELVKEVQKRALKQANMKERRKEVYDPIQVLTKKAGELAEAIRQANYVVVYTGAGVSTAASIPDYRGPNGIWTRLSKGETVRGCNLSDANPTLTHMSILKLYQENYVKHVVSQNCDGLHIRSGMPSHALSEVHGNMYLEVCTECTPERKYFRTFDVTEKTALRRHTTGRYCHYCGKKLRDTIVHFGEKGCLEWPLNWQGAIDAGKATDCILCLGSSLKVLKRYDALWGMKRTKPKRPKLFIVNLQWTPKDTSATLKIHGRCDEVMKLVMEKLGHEIPDYKRTCDPLFRLSTPLKDYELDSKTTKTLSRLENNIKLVTNGSCGEPHLSNGISQNHIDGTTKLHAIKDDGELFESDELAPGWYGKGCAKMKKPKKRRKLK